MCLWPMLQAPDTVSEVHSAVELTGSGLVLGHFSDTSPCLCSFCVRPAPERSLHVSPSAPAAPRSAFGTATGRSSRALRAAKCAALHGDGDSR
jgi:hypothetical protein